MTIYCPQVHDNPALTSLVMPQLNVIDKDLEVLATPLGDLPRA